MTGFLRKERCVHPVRTDGVQACISIGGSEAAVSFPAEGVARILVPGSRRPSAEVSRLVDIPAQPQPCTVSVHPGAVVVSGGGCRVGLSRADGALEIRGRDGAVHVVSDTARWYVREGARFRSRWKLPPDASVMGLGEKIGPLNKRGRRYTNWNTDNPHHSPSTDPIYQSHPFLLLRCSGGRSWGMFFHNTWRAVFDIGRGTGDILEYAADGGDLDLYVLDGPHPADVVRRYTALTGRHYQPPLWALGFQQSRWSYLSRREVERIADEFRARRIPCDALYLDIDYMRGKRVFTVDGRRFPGFRGMVAGLLRRGFKTVVILDPGVKNERAYSVCRDGLRRDVFCRKSDGTHYVGHVWPGKCLFPDFLREDVRRWWGKLVSRVVSWGVAGIWNDMNEPASWPPGTPPAGDPSADQYRGTFSRDVVHGKSRHIPHDEAHNVYGMCMARASFEGWRGHSPRRPLIITRAGYAGVQRFSSVWTGDNNSWWEHLAMSLPMLQSMGVAGLPFVGADIGGFSGDCTPELFARWIQLGVFYPFCRVHTACDTARQEPWSFGPRVERIAREYIGLRYRLLPYFNALFWEHRRTGLPPLRPVVMEFPADDRALEADDQCMIGPFLMIAPVTREGARARSVYLPDGIWYDFHTGAPVRGGGYHVAEAPLERMPIYVRSGAMLPLWPVQQHVGQQPRPPLHLQVYPGGRATFQLYRDDGISWEYEHGAYDVFELSTDATASGVRVRGRTVHRGYDRRPYPVRISRGGGGARARASDIGGFDILLRGD